MTAQQIEDVSIAELDQLHEALGIPTSDIVAGLRLTDDAINQWRTTDRQPATQTLRHLHVLMQLRGSLRDMFAEPKDVQRWMQSELRYLDWRTPQQVIREGDPERAFAAFEALASGIFL